MQMMKISHTPVVIDDYTRSQSVVRQDTPRAVRYCGSWVRSAQVDRIFQQLSSGAHKKYVTPKGRGGFETH